MQKLASLVPVEIIQSKIYLIRGQKVMLDKDLAELYGVPTRVLKQQVRRNLKRFPADDFMFEFTWEEAGSLRSQFVTLKRGEHIKYLPYAFTEQGVAMLSSVLNSDRAIEVNIQIIRVFTKLREIMASHKDLARKIEDLERKFQEKFQEHDKKIVLVFNAIKELLVDKEEMAKKRGPLGFIPPKLPETSNKSKR
ncbi:MAG: ORF6N domain-containing protein [Candidatus Omnitrophica bacterium]|nr:ORF6N domain-containing protein [Candidatus Omnitrophota bacterium]